MIQHNVAELWACGEEALRAAGAVESEIRLAKMGFYQGGYQILAHYFTMIESGVATTGIDANLRSIIADCEAHFARERHARPIVPLVTALVQAGSLDTAN